MRNYETTFIVDAHLPGDEIEKAVEKYSQFVEKNGGKVITIDRWGKRRLAYEIAKKQYGYYICMRFDAEGEFVKTFEREFKLDEQILRYLTTIVPKLVLKEEARVAALEKDSEAADTLDEEAEPAKADSTLEEEKKPVTETVEKTEEEAAEKTETEV